MNEFSRDSCIRGVQHLDGETLDAVRLDRITGLVLRVDREFGLSLLWLLWLLLLLGWLLWLLLSACATYVDNKDTSLDVFPFMFDGDLVWSLLGGLEDDPIVDLIPSGSHLGLELGIIGSMHVHLKVR